MPLFQKVSTITGKTNVIEIPLSQDVIETRLASGKLIQNAFPELTPEQREFLQTGSSPEEWEELFKDQDD